MSASQRMVESEGDEGILLCCLPTTRLKKRRDSWNYIARSLIIVMSRVIFLEMNANNRKNECDITMKMSLIRERDLFPVSL